MKKVSTKKAAAKKIEDLEVKDAAKVTGGAGSGGDRPTESLSLNFTKVEYKN